MQQRKGKTETNELGTIDLPQAFLDDTPHKVKVEGPSRRDKGQKPVSTGGNNGWVVKFTLLAIVVVVSSYFLVAEHEKNQLEHLREDIVHQQVEPLSREWEERYADLEEKNEKLQAQAQEYEDMKKENERLLENDSHARKLRENQENQITYLKKYKNEIQDRISLLSHALLLEKFGPGPHRVEILVAFDPEFPVVNEDGNDSQRIVIELAPVDEMPHVVYWFLEQVSRGLYDGCSFHRNAGHVVQGGPAPNFLSKPDPRLHKRFKDSGFYSILFQEYSPAFPHEKYTLGLAGRPGGPDFYVSTQNNTRLHGPGGQTSYDDPNEADPCFAKVVEGFEIVDRMQMSPLKPGPYKAMKNNVAIVSMTLLPPTKPLLPDAESENLEPVADTS